MTDQPVDMGKVPQAPPGLAPQGSVPLPVHTARCGAADRGRGVGHHEQETNGLC